VVNNFLFLVKSATSIIFRKEQDYHKDAAGGINIGLLLVLGFISAKSPFEIKNGSQLSMLIAVSNPWPS
jgi:hypothetical protein